MHDTSLIDDFAALSRIGATAGGGVERQAATTADGEARVWMKQWLHDRGFRVEQDRVGNLFGLRELRPGAPYVLAGSHLDSQPRGGRFDGAFGVLAAMHAADRLCSAHASGLLTPQFNVGVVNWFNEEGSRFKPSMMGSAVFSRKLPLADALAVTDVDGVSVADALRLIGGAGENDVFGDVREVSSYIEIHIEQGRELDKAGIPVGLVESTWAANKYEIAVLGSQSHTGATAMADRRDALYGAALIVVELRTLAERFGDVLHTSCGELTAVPNSPVVVAREVSMHVDLRSSSEEVLAEADALLHARLLDVEIAADVRIEPRVSHSWRGQHYQREGLALARDTADDLGLAWMPLRTRAGHDSTNMKDIVPTIMLFVPSVDGISHAEQEFTRTEDLSAGVDLLAEALARMVEGTSAEPHDDPTP